MKHLLIGLTVLFVLFQSCTTTKKLQEPKTQVWKGVPVTQKQYDSLLSAVIHDYVKNSSESDLKLLSELKVVYDTIPSKK